MVEAQPYGLHCDLKQFFFTNLHKLQSRLKIVSVNLRKMMGPNERIHFTQKTTWLQFFHVCTHCVSRVCRDLFTYIIHNNNN